MKYSCATIWLGVLVGLFANQPATAQQSSLPADSIAPDYKKAVDLCLLHQLVDAENRLKCIIRNPEHPNREPARALLLEDLYFRQNQYRSYVRFCDSTGYLGQNISIARLLATKIAPGFSIPADSVYMPIHGRRWPMVNVRIHGKTYRFTIDTGAERTSISKRLATELAAKTLVSTSVNNSLHQSVEAIVASIDSLHIGGLAITNLPVWQMRMDGFPVDGLLGWDVLQRFAFTIDYKNRLLILRKPVTHPALSHNLLGIGRPLLVFHSAIGHPLNMFLDTGSNADISLTSTGLSKIGRYQIKHGVGFQHGVGGRFRLFKGQLIKQANLRVGPRLITLKRIPIERRNEVILSILKDGTVGSKLFRKKRFSIDYLNHHFDYGD